jgi:cephalosporin-C deacetylase-like acetyl esterase
MRPARLVPASRAASLWSLALALGSAARRLGAGLACCGAAAVAAASPGGSPLEVRVVPEEPDWTYERGQTVRFRVEVLREGHPLPGATIRYTVGPEGLTIEAPPLAGPGFVRCNVEVTEEGRRYRGLATAAVAPEAIAPTQTDPEDFDAFWDAGKAELARTPIAARLTLLPDASTRTLDVYHVSLATVNARGEATDGADTRVYGILCEPKRPGRFPAVLRLPGAGVYPIGGDKRLADEGYITLEIGIHGIPLTLPPEAYAQLRSGALAGYPAFNLDDRSRYYYRRVHLSCLRALDFLAGRPAFDGRNLFVSGGSQGGQLAIATAALDSRVRACVAYYPAYADVTGYLHGRAGGWPHLLRPDPVTGAPNPHATEAKQQTMRYYDTVNFARRLRVPVLFAWGFNDEVCPPTSLYAAANVVRAPVEVVLARAAGHHPTPEQEAFARTWLRAQVVATEAERIQPSTP